MSTIAVKIVSSVNLGGAHKLHANYKMEIVMDGQGWVLYRRFSAFENLHRNLVSNYGEEKVKQLGLVFPEKYYTGSIAGTLKYIVDIRTVQLQQYIDKLLSVEGTTSISSVGLFFDFENKGVSGLQVQLGQSKILKETFAQTKYVKNYLGVWGASFVVLLKSGSIVVLPSMYDNVSKAEVNMMLGNNAATIVPTAAHNMVTITENATGHRLMISFSTPAEAAFWIRTLSDFSVSTSVAQDTRANTQETNRRNAALTAEQNSRRQPTEVVRAAGTGNTVDELSAAFGI